MHCMQQGHLYHPRVLLEQRAEDGKELSNNETKRSTEHTLIIEPTPEYLIRRD